MNTLREIDLRLGKLLRAIPISCLALLLVILLGNVLSRMLQVWSISWLDEIVQGLFAWMVFIGAAALWRENEHFRVDWLETLLGRSGWTRVLQVSAALLSLGFLFLLTWKGMDLTLRSRAVTPILGFPVALHYAAIPIAGAIMCAYCIADIVSIIGRRNRSITDLNREA